MIPILDLGLVQIPTYFLVISLSVSFLLLFLSYRVAKYHIDRKLAFNIAIILMISGFLGGRLMHVFFEEFDYYYNDPLQILFFWNGGFVYFGGFIAGCISGWVYSYYKKISFLTWADFFAPLMSLAHALGRIGCVLSGCCFGGFCTLPWAINGLHPTASYLVAGELAIFFIILGLEKLDTKTANKSSDGTLFFKWVFLSSFLRYIVEFYRDDFRGRFFRVPLLGTLSVSQAICIWLMLISLGFFVNHFLKSRKSKT